MATEKHLTLKDYAASGKGLKKPGTPCWLCGIPERQEIDEAFRSEDPPTSETLIRRWLIDERGYAPELVTPNKIHHHKSAGHHERR